MWNGVVRGNLGRDAELRETSGGPVCAFSVAHSDRRSDETVWIRCSLWGKRGEALVRHLTKGTSVVVVGEHRLREHDGRTYIELDVQSLDFAGRKDGGRQRELEPHQQAAVERARSRANDSAKVRGDDDLPF